MRPGPPPARRVVVVGAGVAGLACAQELRAARHLGLDVVVLEARARVGGRVLTHWLAAPHPRPSGPGPESQQAPAAWQSPAAFPASAPDGAHPSPQGPTPPPPPPPPKQQQQQQQQQQQPQPQQQQQNPERSPTGAIAHGPAFAPAPSPPAGPRVLPRRHSFSDLSFGLEEPVRARPDGTTLPTVDVGASIMHGCGDENQLVFARAVEEKIRAPVVAGGGFYESTEHAVWYDDARAARLPTESIVEVHNIFFMASRYMAAVASQSDDGAANMQDIFDCGVAYVCEQLGGRTLSPIERAILHKICARSVGYCSPMAVMAVMQASAGMDTTCADTHIGAPYEEDDPPFPGEVPSMSPAGIRHQASRLDRAILDTQKTPKPIIASKKGGNGDRVVLDGYTPFLIDRLKEGVDVRLSQAVCGISCAVKVPSENHHVPPSSEGQGRPFSRARKRSEEDSAAAPSWHNDPEVAERTIFVSTRTGEVYAGDFVVITLPLGVLKEDHEESSVTFSPPLSESKQEAIHGMGMGVHNKIVLRFREEDVFWPLKIPQINCLDPRFQFFNLHSYGKPGVLLVQVFAESGFANGYWDLSDEGVIAEVLLVLGGMFCQAQEDEGGTVEEKDQASTVENDTHPQDRATARAAAARRRVSQLLGIGEQSEKVEGRPDPPSRSETVDQPSATSNAEAEKVGQNSPVKSEAIYNEVKMADRQRWLTWENFPAPEEYIVTRWDQDPFSLGSYSYMPCGSSWQMIDQMAAPEPPDTPNPYLFFAGEHCSDLGWQCVHGAYETGLRAARDIIGLLSTDPTATEANKVEAPIADIPVPRVPAHRGSRASRVTTSTGKDAFWTPEREKALTRSLIGYSDVYGNYTDVIDEIAHALQSFKKEPTNLDREDVTELVLKRIHERVQEDDEEAKAFQNFHTGEKGGGRDEVFPKPFPEVHKRPRLVGLNGSKLKELYAADIVQELKRYASPVFENQISYRETLRKIALMIYKKDGGLMTKRCLSEYLRTQEFGTGPQKELYLEKYLPPK